MNKKKIYSICWIILITIISISLRALFINTDFWYDEACSWYTAKQDFPFGIISNLLNTDLQHTPLYFFFLHFWMKIFGNSEIAIKSLSIIFGIGTLPLIYTATKKLSKEQIAIMTTLVASVSPLLVYFSSEARMYPMVVFLVMLSINYLIDFEQKPNKKNIIKLTITNILIPYTLVGGILYNISIVLTYGIYLFIYKKDYLKLYLKGLLTEIIALLPYFAIIIYYLKMRMLFVISHEGDFSLAAIVDGIRNFFSLNIVSNIYWPSLEPYYINIASIVLVFIPCGYLLYGIIKGTKNSNEFLRVLYFTFILCFFLSILTSSLKIHVFTVRYILYLLPPMLILAIIGLSQTLNIKHLKIFVTLFVLIGTVENTKYYYQIKPLKTMAFKAVKYEAEALKFTVDDIIIMPFGSDAPYYFRKLSDPEIYNFDFHKELRNPNNAKFYSSEQQKLMKGKTKYQTIYDEVFAQKGFSENHFMYFKQNVNMKVPKDRFVLIALYGDDANSLVKIEDLRQSIKGIEDIKKRTVEILLKKYLYDIIFYIEQDFNFIGTYKKDNYTYMLFQKR